MLDNKHTEWLMPMPMAEVMGLEHSLKFKRQLLQHVFDNALESIIVTNADGVIQRVNPAFTQITGYSPEEVLGKTPRLMQSARHDPDFYRQMWQQLLHTGSWTGQVWNRRKSGEVYPQWLSINTLTNEHGQITHRVAIGHDLSGQRSYEQDRTPFTFKDPLTQLGNRQLLATRLDQALAEAQRNKIRVGLMVLDIGRLKPVNEQLGMTWGDDVLRQQARTLQAAVDEADTLVRLQGDVFAVLRHSKAEDATMAQLADKLLHLLAQPMVLADQNIVCLQPSIGISVYPRDAREPENLLQAAEYAHAMAKREGRNRFQFVDQHQHELHHRELVIEHSLSHMLSTGESQGVSLHYQPQVCSIGERIVGLEALLRWTHPRLGPLSPVEFIPVAEQSGLSVRLDRWVIEQVCAQVALWRGQGLAPPVVSVNLGAQQFGQPDFCDWLMDTVTRFELRPQQLRLEVTESTMMEQIEAGVNMLQQLREQGFSLSLDDFGTGYSALSCLHRFPLDELKIDRSFMVEACENERALVLLRTIMELARQLSLSLVVEGVEQAEQLALLNDFGPLTVQGYYYYKPMPVDEVLPLLSMAADRPEDGMLN
ncbi:PAS/PAC sensor-containing diguanylate cyclase/phosphodiesterase [Oceanimonas sp. GK1]|uniref:putative bifunctional diguanylate cyclase/phosphodiesterase n=1 Tax=Oceanimonas sp. (strain GK1 / IBRC-M 10197) TaxID=511062 RepID=UPI0002494EE5|nr:GGDEF domain-containing phosphodiesterase [Oceanimonas sp. GK1]AEY01695.1 PAS/PAC sensor-containing diguanylate cyclase/phosphodiesterase [Oceanimonas sp. GK1]